MKQVWQTRIFLAAVALLMISCDLVEVQNLDVVIANGRVMDPATGFDSVANVGIDGGTIVTITTDPLDGDRVIDATGMVVSPGFVDHHVHSLDPFGIKLLLRDGVTTALELENGVFPVAEWYAAREGMSQVNFGASVSHFGVRAAVLDDIHAPGGDILAASLDGLIASSTNWRHEQATPEQLRQMSDAILRGFDEGGIGIGLPIGYYLAGATSGEFAAMFDIAGQHDLPVFVHARFSSQTPPNSGLLALQEAIAAAAIYDAPVVLQHFHQQTLADTRTAIKIIKDARAAGVRVLGEVYPYNFGATFITADYIRPENYGPNMGRTYSDIIEITTGRSLDRALYEELLETAPQTIVMFYGVTVEDMEYAVAHPGVSIGSDAAPALLPDGSVAGADTPYGTVSAHPRSAGTHAKVLRMVREDQLMPLMRALNKMSYLPAKFLEDAGVPDMARKGRLSIGADADIVVFDPATVTDNATMRQGGLPSTGIHYVLVSGVVVVDEQWVLPDVWPGQPVRAPGQDAISKRR